MYGCAWECVYEMEPLINLSTIACRKFAVQPIYDEEAKVNQISIIISAIQKSSFSARSQLVTGDIARVKYEALTESLQSKLYERAESELWIQTKLLEKIENDIYNLQLLQESSNKIESVRTDLAMLCKKVTLLEKDFASAFGCTIVFSLPNFGMEDITPLLAGNFTVTPEEFTGPFFTAPCDVKKMEFIIRILKWYNLSPKLLLIIEQDNIPLLSIC